jgi:hypothetical protein
MLPQTNAVLRRVERSGTSEDYDVAAGVDTAVWTGAVDAYLAHRRATLGESQAYNTPTVSYLVVDGRVPVTFEAGDSVVLEQGGVELTRRVRDIRQRRVDVLPDLPIRLDLYDT